MAYFRCRQRPDMRSASNRHPVPRSPIPQNTRGAQTGPHTATRHLRKAPASDRQSTPHMLWHAFVTNSFRRRRWLSAMSRRRHADLPTTTRYDRTATSWTTTGLRPGRL